jgi:glycosyltransferase involved in cell wall biosynthesis
MLERRRRLGNDRLGLTLPVRSNIIGRNDAHDPRVRHVVINGQRVLVVMPAYNAASTLLNTYGQLPRDVVDDVLLVDDASADATVRIAAEAGIRYYVHPKNRGYGGNQKTCYAHALETDADIVVMLHPDYQYPPRLVTAMAAMISCAEYDVVLGSRILGGQALRGGMPFYKYVANRALTLAQNAVTRAKLSEYHTGYRAFRRAVLERLPFERNSDDFVFDNQILCQVLAWGYRIGEVSCRSRYFPEASSINFRRSVVYGLGVLATTLSYRLHRWGLRTSPIFQGAPRPGSSE